MSAAADLAAMAEVCPPYLHFDASPLHRKRRLDDSSDDSSIPDTKRRSIHALPIRSSAPRPLVTIPAPSALSLFTPIYQQPPTPVDTSDDESASPPSTDSTLLHADPPFARGPDKSTSSTPPLRADCPDSVDVEMDVEMNLDPVRQRMRRARSNDIVPPHCNPHFLNPMDTNAGERVPTPINSHFDSRVIDLPSVPRHQFPPLRTNLSPMIEQESWISRDGLPSPVEMQDLDTVMMLDSHDAAVARPRNHRDHAWGRHTPNDVRPDGGAGGPPADRSRRGRLHMGFLNGCEKCAQKVPGHYSHILWS